MDIQQASPRKVWWWVALAVLALGLLACGTTTVVTATPLPATPVPPTVPPTAVPPTAAPSGGDTGSAGTVSLILDNQSSLTLCYLYISPVNQDDWGDDQLGADNTVAPGDSFTITDIPAGTYDLRVETCDDQNVERRGEVLDGETTWTITD